MLRVLCVEDSPEDAALVGAALEQAFGAVSLERVVAEEDLRRALRARWDVVIADHCLPGFSGLAALEIVRDSGLDLPFIVVSGTLDEASAVEAMKAGAQDFVTKGNLSRLGPAVARELKDAAVRQGRLRAESMLRVAQSRLATVLRSTQDRVFTYDGALRITAVFGAWQPLAPGTPVGVSWEELLGQVGQAHQAELRRALAGENVVFEWTHEEVHGRSRHYQTSVSPLRGQGEAVLGGVGVTRDITRLKEVEAELLVSERMAAVGALAAGVAHEINNPLACVLANLGVAQEALDALPAQGPERALLAEVLADARTASERVREIVADLRLLSRGDDRRRAVDLRAVAESAVRLAQNQLRHRARLARELGAVPPVWASETRLGQVLLNLLVNAAQAIPEGQAAAHTIALRTGTTPAGEAFVEVEDSGVGMPPEVLSRLFTPFFTTKPKGEGVGLGLSISQRIVRESGGRIEVRSQLGRGSLFRVTLPAHAAAEPAGPGVEALAPAPARPARILVVDDDEAVARAIRRTLQPPHQVEVADGPAAVARVAAGERFDLVLCDLMMPSMTGMEVLARLRAADPALAERVRFITGGAFTPASAEFLRGLEERQLTKPFAPEELRRLVREALEGRT